MGIISGEGRISGSLWLLVWKLQDTERFSLFKPLRGGVRGGPPLFQHRLLDRSKSTDFLPHLHLGVAVRLGHRLGQIAEEVVDAVAMRDVGELFSDPGDEGLLLVRDPEPHRLA
jgi:hypothetical protein